MTTAAPEKPKTEPKTERKIEPAPKVVFKIDAEGGEKLGRLPSLLGTIRARKQAATAKRKNAFEDRDSYHEQIEELGTEARDRRTPEYLELRANLGETLDLIESLDAQIKGCNSAYDRIAEECQQGKLAFAELTVDELLEELGKKSGGQMTLAQAAEGEGKTAAPGALWYAQHEAYPHFWAKKGETPREWGIVKQHVDKLVGIDSESPLKFASWLLMAFKENKSTKERVAALPSAPTWFYTGVFDCMAHHAAGTDETEILDASWLADLLKECATVDIDAFLDLCGGRESAAAKVAVGK